ncbi:MAG: SpoIIE family protein phosphatase [Candidatus Marinimicrobia bacterium]|nr:SpoIIE family protein phosphatase [Candidatus Neomarinimicrobiota bacterium]
MAPGNRSEVQRLRDSVKELSILNEIATAISGVWNLEEVVDLIVKKCVKYLHVEQGAVMLLEDEKSDRPFQTMVRRIDDSQSKVPYHFGVQLSGWMLKNREPLLVNDFQHDDRFQLTENMEFPVRSLLSVPLMVKGRMIGLLNVFNKRLGGEFTEDDQRILSIIASQSAQVLEQARLYKQEKQLIRLEEDIRVARDIQQKLLPKENPQIEGYDIIGYSISAKEVGGDYYDFIKINADKLAVCLGDISGKGIPASLLMANLQATLRGQAVNCASCAECLKKSNNFLYHSTNIQKFATLFYAILDTQTNQLCYSRAGHPPPIFLDAEGGIEELSAGGMVLGFQEEVNYKQESITFNQGDLLVVYSDGVTEAGDPKEESFDEWRLKKIIKKNKDKSAKQILEAIIEAVQNFTGRDLQRDDMTLLIIKR